MNVITGHKKTEQTLQNLSNFITKTMPSVMQSTVDRFATGASQGYANAFYEGNNDVEVSADHPEVNRWTITAAGETVLFIEFGTGRLIQRPAEMLDAAANYPPASWSAEHAQYLTDEKKRKAHHDQWPYAGKWTSGNPAANVMYQTKKSMRDDLPGILGDELRKALK